ncbi:ATM_1a_G0053810.mRNA.1.CDS.1 [Saccharomyces cerevisiae]|nr:ATM_1a_G0053810.mRNA.1.CDS.1 [Saccharomyces cerevisiae]CAI7372205.1 ATM_1a_G0053810.mRNA.1.CDS.1 [Saccharomyces cerevisiae]
MVTTQIIQKATTTTTHQTEKGRGFTKKLTYRGVKDLNRFLYLGWGFRGKTISGEMDTQLMLSNVLKEKLNLADDGENERYGRNDSTLLRISKWGSHSA